MSNMYDTWAPLQAVLNTGPHFTLENQAIWTAPLEEFGIPCRITRPLRLELDIFPQEDGLLVRGSLEGSVALACYRCNEEAEYTIRHSFDDFEPLPVLNERGELAEDPEVDEYFIRFSQAGKGSRNELEINLAALAWEEFAQALPVQPLCRENCAGLCSVCGANRNENACNCENEKTDPRLEKLRGLKIK